MGGPLEDAFGDIETLADGCHFRDCRHEQEPRCAVQRAVDEGALPAGRLESFRKLQRETGVQASGVRISSRRSTQKRSWKIMHKAQRQYKPRG